MRCDNDANLELKMANDARCMTTKHVKGALLRTIGTVDVVLAARMIASSPKVVNDRG